MFLRPKRSFTIQDMGSVHGTYIQMETIQSEKVKLDDQVVRKGQNYLIGSDIFMNVIEL